MAIHGTLTIVVAFTLTSLSTVVVGLRFYSRYFLVRKLSPSDWVMLAALICTWGSAVVNYYQIQFMNYDGVAHNLDAWKRVVTGGLLTMWIYRLFYLIDTCLVKLSILLFFNYIASPHKSFHRIVKSIAAIVLLGSFSMIIAAIFSCNPPADAWSFTVFWKNLKGDRQFQCYDPVYLWFFTAGFNLITDMLLWILPPLFLLNLQALNTRRRLELIGIFSIGIVAISASAIRLWILAEWTSSFIKQGQNTGNLLIWSQVEQHAGIISASIPFLRPLYRKVCCLGGRRKQRSSPSPAALIPQRWDIEGNPVPPRPPIIPSPSPTTLDGSTDKLEGGRLPTPLSPVFSKERATSAENAV